MRSKVGFLSKEGREIAWKVCYEFQHFLPTEPGEIAYRGRLLAGNFYLGPFGEECKNKVKKITSIFDARQSMVSMHGPLGYEPSALPLRHSANLLLMLLK